MTAFRDGVGRLVDRTEREVTALYERHVRGEIDREEFVDLAAVVIARARMQGVGLADLVLAAEIIRVLRVPAGPIGIEPPDGDFERLHTSLAAVLERDIETATTDEELRASQRARLLRLGRDSAAEAAVWGYGLAMTMRGIGGWIRVTDLDPCQVCANLADGIVRSPSVPMLRHTGCACVQQSVF